MKKIVILLAISIFILPTNSSANRVKVFGNVFVSIVDDNKDPTWVRENDKQPKYPSAMAIANLRGCAIISFDVNPLGRTENMKAIAMMPSRKIASEARVAIRKWKWVNQKNDEAKEVESKTVRIDYCIGGSSTEESNKLCKKQSERQCK